MSEANGNNPVTGSAHAEAAVQAEQDEKQAKRTAAEQLRAGKRFDGTLVKAIENTAKSVDGLAVAIVNCQLPVQVEVNGELVDGPAPWQLVVDDEGKPFASWADYLAARMAVHTFLHKLVRDEVITILLDHGMSIRQAAKATNSSVGTVAGVKNGTRAAQPSGESAGTESTPVSAASKLVKQVLNATDKLRDKVADMTDADLEKLRLDLVDTAKKVAAMQKLRVQIAEAEKLRAEQEKQNAPAPAPVKQGPRAKRAA